MSKKLISTTPESFKLDSSQSLQSSSEISREKFQSYLYHLPRKEPSNHEGLWEDYEARITKDARDTRNENGYAQEMSEITREEFNAKLETIEVKMDARVESISSKIEGFLAAQSERDKRLDEAISGVRRDIDKLGSLKLNIWGAMLTAVGLGVAITALSVSFYQTGKAERPDTAQSPAVIAPPAPTQQHH